MPERERKTRRRIAPRLADGSCRLGCALNLPPGVHDGITAIARSEGQSRSWVIEQCVIRYFRLDRPEYVPRKKTR